MRTQFLLASASLLLLATSFGCNGMTMPGGGTSVGSCDPILFIREGVTSQSTISERCGPPTTQERTSSGMTWIYNPDATVSTVDLLASTCGGMTGAAYNICVASIPAKLYMNINFDQRGIVTDYTARKEERQIPQNPPAP